MNAAVLGSGRLMTQHHALLGAIPSCVVDAHRSRAVRFRRSPASQDPSERHRPPPTQVRGGLRTLSMQNGTGLHPDHPERARPPTRDTCRCGGDR
jgi:hypothetical protein